MDNKERFSLLLLDPGEIYFEDFGAVLVTSETTIETFESNKLEGRLKLCSKSLVFDPKDFAKPLIKIPLKEIKLIEKWKGSARFIEGENVLWIESNLYIEMLEMNVIAPYKFKENGKFIISLNYASVNNCMPQICQLMRAATLPAFEQADMISVIVHSRHARILFDPLWMDLYEQIQFECQANKITPLVVNPGRVVLSDKKIYYQPYNNIEAYPVVKIHLNSIQRVFKRRFLLRHTGLEIYYLNGSEYSKESHLYISLLNQTERDNFYNLLMQQEELKLSNNDQDVMTLQWQNGVISNYEYLLYINSLGDRSKNDLTQYPVFPWVILDYTSETINLDDENIYRDLTKPVGALNKVRLSKILERYEEMTDLKFMYGSHYSTPGFVLFYLVRLYPHYMLCLQSGRFDHPDRMFNSCQHLAKNILNDMSDFKELIPEFFDLDQEGSFLMNNLGINFGYRHSGVKVDDVELPKWAESPKHFVKTLREALESDYVSENLHHWIDLIFGYKQRGKEAVKAHNLFYYLCYEGNVDLDQITDMNRKHTLEVQIMEFGQIPKQVFKVPHPKRRKPLQLLLVPQLSSSDNTETTPDGSIWNNLNGLKLEATFSTHKDKVACLFAIDDFGKVVSVGHDSKLKVFCLRQKRQIRSASLGPMPLSYCIQIPNTSLLIIGTCGNEIILYDLDFGKVVETVPAHVDVVSCIAWAPSLNILCSGSGDCTVSIWQGSSDPANGTVKPIAYLKQQFDHNSSVSSITFSRNDDCLAVGTNDGDIYIWSMQDFALSKKYPKWHNKKITCLNYSPDGLKLVTCSLDKSFQVLDINSGMSLYRRNFDSALLCLKWDGCLLLLGAENGKLYLWNIDTVRLLLEVQAHQEPLSCLDISVVKEIILTGSYDHEIKVWSPQISVADAF